MVEARKVVQKVGAVAFALSYSAFCIFLIGLVLAMIFGRWDQSMAVTGPYWANLMTVGGVLLFIAAAIVTIPFMFVVRCAACMTRVFDPNQHKFGRLAFLSPVFFARFGIEVLFDKGQCPQCGAAL